jgi:DNA (cytosine-5)-methyltransferase 1
MKKNKDNSINDYAVIDLFCGVGGLTHGFYQENFRIAAGIDFDKSCEYAFEENNKAPFLYKDITKLTAQELEELYPKNTKKILVGCAPCQPFSVYNHKNNNNPELQDKDKKWSLLYSFAELIEKLKPEIVSMENVPQLRNFNDGAIFNDFVKHLELNGYYVSYKVVNAQNFGVPQRRKRLVLLASLNGKISLIDSSIEKCKTVRDAISDLPPVEDGIAAPTDALHIARKLTDLNKKRIQATKEGGSWRDWDESLILDCHKKESGKSFGSVYGRMKWDDVSPTMTTYCNGLGNGRFGHPEQDRAITLREAAIFQDFPKDYKFIDPKRPFSPQTLARQIGNAVPVGLGRAIAKSIKNHIENPSLQTQNEPNEQLTLAF